MLTEPSAAALFRLYPGYGVTPTDHGSATSSSESVATAAAVIFRHQEAATAAVLSSGGSNNSVTSGNSGSDNHHNNNNNNNNDHFVLERRVPEIGANFTVGTTAALSGGSGSSAVSTGLSSPENKTPSPPAANSARQM